MANMFTRKQKKHGGFQNTESDPYIKTNINVWLKTTKFYDKQKRRSIYQTKGVNNQ